MVYCGSHPSEFIDDVENFINMLRSIFACFFACFFAKSNNDDTVAKSNNDDAVEDTTVCSTDKAKRQPSGTKDMPAQQMHIRKHIRKHILECSNKHELEARAFHLKTQENQQGCVETKPLTLFNVITCAVVVIALVMTSSIILLCMIPVMLIVPLLWARFALAKYTNTK